MPSEISRRRLLARGAATAAGAAAASLLPPSLTAALAQPAPRGGLHAIEHVVLLMQENRSFDHYYGTLRGVRGFGDRNAVRLPDGRDVFHQGTTAAPVLPFGIRAAAAAQRKDIEYVGSLDHSWSGGHAAWHDGWMDRWTAAKSPATMAHYDRRDIAFQYELADTFTICDAYHSAVHTSTSPNRNYWVSGTTGYEPLTGARAVDNDAYDEIVHPGYTWTTYAERLQRAGVDWKVYSEWDDFTDNNLDFFRSFKTVMRKALAAAGQPFLSLTDFYAAAAGKPADQQDAMLAALDRAVAALPAADRELFDRGLRRGRPGSLADTFAADVAAGTLPKVSYLVPNAEDSEHPSVSSPIHSATITYKILDALASHPEVWRKTAVILSFDENDGFFDHVPPPVAPAGDPEEWYQGLPVGLGMRVPMLVISPWTVGGYVSSELFDHTSQVRFLEKWTGVAEPNISAWRRRVTGDLTGVFDFDRGRPQPPVTSPGAIPPFTGRWNPQPPADQAVPAQEPGTRPARPLPYRPEAGGALDADAGVFRLRAANTGTASAHLALHPYAGEYPAPAHRDIAARTTLDWDVPVTAGRYDFTVTGPNGFRRSFTGAADGAAAALEITAATTGDSRVLRITLRNHGRTPLTAALTPTAYAARTGAPARRTTVRPGGTATLTWPTAEAHGWYDLDLTVDQDTGFTRRLMGHLENGRESVSG